MGFGFFSLMEKLLRFKSRTPPDALGKLPDKTLDPDPDVTFGGQRRISGPISADPISSTSAVPEGGWWFRFVLTKWRPNCVLLVFFWRASF